MAVLSEHRAGIVRALIEAAPDGVLCTLEAALRGEMAGGSLSVVRDIVTAEVHDRAVRNAVFEPIAPLFAARSDGFDQMRFPTGVLGGLWRALKAAHPNETALAAAMPLRPGDDDPPPVFDELCLLASRGLREASEGFQGVLKQLEAAGPATAFELMACLDLTSVARRSLRHLPGWLSRMTDERAATARLTFKDAVAVAEDDGPRLIEILFAHLQEPWTILRVVSAVMLKPGDSYASGSELADFGTRLLRDVDRRIAVIKAFDYDGGVEAGKAAAEALRIAAAVSAEFELSISMSREGPWGEQSAKQKQTMAALAEGHLRKADRAVADALPVHPVRMGGRVVKSARGAPRLESPPDPAAIARAKALLAFFAGSRAAAAQGGYGATRAKVQEDLAQRLDGYTEELLATLHAGGLEHPENAHAYLEVVAEFTGLVYDDSAAQIVRRRAAAA